MEILEGQVRTSNGLHLQIKESRGRVVRRVNAPRDMAALHERMDGIGRATLRKARQADDFLGRLEQVKGLCEHLTEAWHADVLVIQILRQLWRFR